MSAAQAVCLGAARGATLEARGEDTHGSRSVEIDSRGDNGYTRFHCRFSHFKSPMQYV